MTEYMYKWCFYWNDNKTMRNLKVRAETEEEARLKAFYMIIEEEFTYKMYVNALYTINGEADLP